MRITQKKRSKSIATGQQLWKYSSMYKQLSIFDQVGYRFSSKEEQNLVQAFNDASAVSEVQLIYEPPLSKAKLPQVHNSKDVEQIFRKKWPKGKMGLQEHFYMMMLNQGNRVLGVTQIGVGGISSVIVDLRLVFATAVKACSSALIVAHNHPSGTLTASHADMQLTEKLMAAGKVLDMKVLDHLILTPWDYYSMADEGVMPVVGDFPWKAELR